MKPRGRHAIFQVGRRHAVEPGLDRVAAALDAQLVPLALLERLAGRLVVLQVVEPAAAPFVVDAARSRPAPADRSRPGSRAPGRLESSGLLAAVVDFRRLRRTTGCESARRSSACGSTLKSSSKHEVAVVACRCTRTSCRCWGRSCRRSRRSRPDTSPCPAALLPAVERLAVEQRTPGFSQLLATEQPKRRCAEAEHESDSERCDMRKFSRTGSPRGAVSNRRTVHGCSAAVTRGPKYSSAATPC